MKSQTLSGCPSVTDSDVNTNGRPFGPDLISLTGRSSFDSSTTRTPGSARRAPRLALGCRVSSRPHLPPPSGVGIGTLGCRPRLPGPFFRAAPNVLGDYSGHAGDGQGVAVAPA